MFELIVPHMTRGDKALPSLTTNCVLSNVTCASDPLPCRLNGLLKDTVQWSVGDRSQSAFRRCN